MTETITEPRAIPRWSARDRDLWEDLFEAYSVALLGREDICLGRAISKAGELADEAVKECQFRGWVQRKIRPRVKKKAARRKR